MNLVYRIIWSAVSQSWVVVSELTHAKGKQKSALQNSVLTATTLCLGLYAAPAISAQYTSTILGNFTFPGGETSTVTTTGDNAQGIRSDSGVTISSNDDLTIYTDGSTSSGVRSNNAGTVNLSNVDITTLGGNSMGLLALGGTINLTGNTTIKTAGDGSMGVTANGAGSVINLGSGDTKVTTTGEYNPNNYYYAHGLLAENGGSITGTGKVTVDIYGDYGEGIYSKNASSINLAEVDVTTRGSGSFGLLANSSGSLTLTGLATIHTSGVNAAGINATDTGTHITLVDANITTTGAGVNTGGIMAGDNAHIISTGSVKINSTGYGVYSSKALIDLVNSDVTTSGNNANGITAQYGGVVNNTGSAIVRTTGSGAVGVYAQSTGSSVTLAANTTVNTSGDNAHGMQEDNSAQIQTNGGTITTTGKAAHGFVVTRGSTKTFDGTANNILPTIVVSGAGSAMLDANGAGSQIALTNQMLNITGAALTDTWGAKAEAGGLVAFVGGSSGGTGLWVTGANSQITLSGTNAAGSRVLLANGGTLSTDPTGSVIGSLEGDVTGTVHSGSAGGNFTLGENNVTGNGSLVDNANFAGIFSNIGQLSKTGTLTQILSGAGNTVGSVDVNGGILRFEQAGAFSTTGDYSTQNGATTDIGRTNSTLVVGGAFTQHAGSNLNVTLGATPDITADTARLDGRIAIRGFADGPTPVKSSEVTNNSYTVIHTINGITGDFVNNPLLASGLDYLLHDGHLSTNGKDYNLGFRLAWTEGLQDKSTGNFTLNDGTAFDVDTVLADQTAPVGGFSTGWDGKSLTKAGNGLLVLSAINTYTGSTTLNAGTLRADVADSIVDSRTLTVNGGVFNLNGNNQRVNRLSGTGGEIMLNGATLTVNNADATDNTRFDGDIIDGTTRGGGLTKDGNGTLTLAGKTGWTGITRINKGELVLDGANGGAQLVSDIIGADDTALSLRHGASLTGTIDPTDVNIDSASRWNMTGNSLVDNVNLAGTLNMVAPASLPMTAGKTLTTRNWNGQNGTVVLNTVLGDDASVTDKIVVNGDTSGNTFVKVNNAGGHGAQTVEGIRIVEVTGLSDGTFTKSGRIVAGAYDYSLVKKGSDWYLTSLYAPPAADPTTDPVAVIRPEAGSYTANLAAANTMFITRLHDRLGETQYTDALTGEKKVTSLWLRQVGGHNAWNDGTGQLKTQSNRYVTQLGGDIAQWSSDGFQRLHLGVMAGYGHNSSNTQSGVSGYRSDGTVSGYSAGVYATWYQNDETRQGLYLDSWAQYGWFDNDVKGQDLQSESYTSSGITASVEAGYTHMLGAFRGSMGSLNEWFIQPQAQAIWMGVNADDHKEHNGTRVNAKGEGNLQTRLGVRTYLKSRNKMDESTDRIFQPFVEMNWIHNTQDFGTRMDGVSIYQAGARNIGEIKTGVEGKVSQHLNLWGNVGVQVGDKGYNDTSAMVGVKYSF